eukprot:TRINITY_DN3680_c0_g1_i3.p1 TRINITY_DN3680_c0_g1~~TRINITY_DN3680_c0_g1_i3.p1  ORF type:complete len:1199 (+),score=280.13 TRINITY_DN3680_c0_g1_i3:65-3661(+)
MCIRDSTSGNSHSFESVWATNCAGGSDTQSSGSGGVSVSYKSTAANTNNSHAFTDVHLRECVGGSNTVAGGAGGINVGYRSTAGNNAYNSHAFQNVSVTQSEGGSDTQTGGAGGISISERAASTNRFNSHSFDTVTITQCEGGSNSQAGGAGGLAVTSVGIGGGNSNNSHAFDTVLVAFCEGGSNSQSSGAGGIAINAVNFGGNNNFNSHSFETVTVTNCTGGSHTRSAGAGGISVSSRSTGANSYNVYGFASVAVANCTGGISTQSGGAGGVSVAYRSEGANSRNVHTFSDVSVVNCTGGSSALAGGGASNNATLTSANASCARKQPGGGSGGIGFSYSNSKSHNSHNSHSFVDLLLEGCVGGDFSQGAGGLGLYMLPAEGETLDSTSNTVHIENTTIRANVGGSAVSPKSRMGLGVAGGARVYFANSQLCTVSLVRTSFVANRLAAGCLESSCVAGGMAVFGANTSAVSSVFENNTSPVQAGALEATSHVQLTDSVFFNNQALVFGTARLQSVSATNSTLYFANDPRALSAEFETGSTFTIVCVQGNRVDAIRRRSQWQCKSCPKNSYSLAAATSVNGANGAACNKCPTTNTRRVTCSGGASVSSQRGFFVHRVRRRAITRRRRANTRRRRANTRRRRANTRRRRANTRRRRANTRRRRAITRRRRANTRRRRAITRRRRAVTRRRRAATRRRRRGTVATRRRRVASVSTRRLDIGVNIDTDTDPVGEVLEVDTCPNPSACSGGSETSQCSQGYTGDLCAQCEDGYGSAQYAPLVCDSCPSTALKVTLSTVLGLAVIAVGTYATVATISSVRATSILALLKIGLTHLTVLAAVTNTEWAWKDGVQNVLEVLTTASSPIGHVYLDCVMGWSFEQQFAFYTSLPVVASLVVVAGCVLACKAGFSRLGGIKQTISTVAIFLVYTFMPQTLANLVKAFPCYGSLSGPDMMVYDPTTECWEGKFAAPALIGMLVLLLVAGWLLGFRAYQQRAGIQAITRATRELVTSTKDIQDLDQLDCEQFGFLYRGYKSECYLWELVPFSLKCLVLMIATATPPTSDFSTRSLLLLLIITGSVCLQVHFRPYAKRPAGASNLQALDILTQMCSLISVALAQYVSALANSEQDHEHGQQAATVVLLVCNFLLGLLFASQGCRSQGSEDADLQATATGGLKTSTQPGASSPPVIMTMEETKHEDQEPHSVI